MLQTSSHMTSYGRNLSFGLRFVTVLVILRCVYEGPITDYMCFTSIFAARPVNSVRALLVKPIRYFLCGGWTLQPRAAPDPPPSVVIPLFFYYWFLPPTRPSQRDNPPTPPIFPKFEWDNKNTASYKSVIRRRSVEISTLHV